MYIDFFFLRHHIGIPILVTSLIASNCSTKYLPTVRLSSGVGAMVVGFQVGSVGVRERKATELARSDAYWHDEGSFRSMWDQVGRETGTRWECEVRLLRWEEVGWDPRDTEYLGDEARVIEFVVKRVT